MTIVYLVLIAIALVGVAAIFSPRVRQALRIWGNKGVSASTNPVDRAKDRVQQAINKLPQQRELVARLMTAADRAQKAVTDKEAEAEKLLTRYQTAVNAKATPETQNDIKVQWKTAKDSVPTLKQVAVDAHTAAEEAQKELEGYIRLIKTSQEGVAQLEANSQLAAILRESTAFRNQVNDLKNGLGGFNDEKKQIEDELTTARNASELSRGTASEREMQRIEEQQAVNDADAEIQAALAARNKPQQ